MAKPTKFVAACKTVEARIVSATTHGTGAHKRRQALMKDLARWATSFYAAGSFERLIELKRLPWKRWDSELQWPTLQVAAALRLMVRHNLSRAQAMTESNVPSSTLDFVVALVKRAGLTLAQVVEDQSETVDAVVTSSTERVHVHLESRALEDILLAAAEAYRVSPGKGYKYTEIFGLCFGSVRRRVHPKAQVDVIVNVSRVATQLRAKGNASSVTPNHKSLLAQVEVGETFFPHLELVGDYHTHPYRSFSELAEAPGWQYSEADEESLPTFSLQVRRRHNPPVFSLIVAVAQGGKTSASATRKQPNVVQLTVGRLYFVIGCYRILVNKSYDAEVRLNIPSRSVD